MLLASLQAMTIKIAFLRVVFALFNLAFFLDWFMLTKIKTAKIMIMATIIKSSIKVNPFFFLAITIIQIQTKNFICLPTHMQIGKHKNF